MDPKAFPNHLDPKLKEAYDRVMGEAAAPQSAPSQTPPEPAPSQPAAPTPQPPQSQSIGSAIFGTAQPVQQPAPQVTPVEQPSVVSPIPPIQQQPTNSYSVPFLGASEPQPGVINSQTMTTQSNVSQVKSHQASHPMKKPMDAKPLLFGILGVVFLLVYAVVWVKIFNIQLPFALPF